MENFYVRNIFVFCYLFFHFNVRTFHFPKIYKHLVKLLHMFSSVKKLETSFHEVERKKIFRGPTIKIFFEFFHR